MKTRRLLFFQYILQEEENALIIKFLISQINKPLARDWWNSALDDMEELNINLTLHEIKVMSKKAFKAKVKNAASNAAFKWLNIVKANLSKVKDTKHEKFEMQKYLSNPLLSIDRTKFLFHLRSRMLFLRANYRHLYNDDICPLCCNLPGQRTRDTQEHLLLCKKLKCDTDVGQAEQGYDDIFSPDLEQQARITILLENKYKLRKKIESESQQ